MTDEKLEELLRATDKIAEESEMKEVGKETKRLQKQIAAQKRRLAKIKRCDNLQKIAVAGLLKPPKKRWLGLRASICPQCDGKLTFETVSIGGEDDAYYKYFFCNCWYEYAKIDYRL